MNEDEFEYLGLEFCTGGKRKGSKEDNYHKILVKSKVLVPIVEELRKSDEFYIPESGQVLGYTNFYSSNFKILYILV